MNSVIYLWILLQCLNDDLWFNDLYFIHDWKNKVILVREKLINNEIANVDCLQKFLCPFFVIDESLTWLNLDKNNHVIFSKPNSSWIKTAFQLHQHTKVSAIICVRLKSVIIFLYTEKNALLIKLLNLWKSQHSF